MTLRRQPAMRPDRVRLRDVVLADADLAEQRSLEKAGYRREGIQRGAQYRAGGYHDPIVYGRLRDDRA